MWRIYHSPMMGEEEWNGLAKVSRGTSSRKLGGVTKRNIWTVRTTRVCPGIVMTTGAGCVAFRLFRARDTFARMTRERSVRVLRLRAALVALLAVSPACFVFNRGNKAERLPAFDVPEGEIALTVTNHNFLDVVVYVLHDGLQTRVGTVTASSSALLFLRVRLLGMGHELQLYGRAIGSEAFARTQTLIIQPGQYIEWTLETDLRRSSVGVY